MAERVMTTIAIHKEVSEKFKRLKWGLKRDPSIRWRINESTLTEFLVKFYESVNDALFEAKIGSMSEDEINKIDVRVRILLKKIEEAMSFVPEDRKLTRKPWSRRTMNERLLAADTLLTKLGFVPNMAMIENYLESIKNNPEEAVGKKSMEEWLAEAKAPEGVTYSDPEKREMAKRHLRIQLGREPSENDVDAYLHRLAASMVKPEDIRPRKNLPPMLD